MILYPVGFCCCFARGLFAGGLRRPLHPGARRGRERDTYGGMRVAVVKNASKYFCKSPRFSAERFAKNFAAACRIGGRQLRRASAIFSPQTPLFPAGGVQVGSEVLYIAVVL